MAMHLVGNGQYLNQTEYDLYIKFLNETVNNYGSQEAFEQAAIDFSTSNGGNYEVDEDEYLELEAAVNAGKTEAANKTSGTQATTATGSETSEQIKEELDELKEERSENYEKMKKIEGEIEKLADQAKANITKAVAAQRAEIKEHEEETQATVQENIQAYIDANKEGGEGMTREQLQENIKGSLSDIPNIGDAVSAAIAANDELNKIDAHLVDLRALIQDTHSLEIQINAKEAEYESVKAAEEAAAEAAKNSCDPIGFTMGEGENQAQYDFIIDDGAFDSTNDFLGAENQWTEMINLDTDGDNIVSTAELQAGNIKAVKTNADGTQEIVDLASEFGEDFSIDLSSYTQGGSHSAVNTTSDHDNDGVMDQELLGTFNVNANGQTISGYNTLDDVEYLTENYNIAAGTETEDKAQDFSDALKIHAKFEKEYTELSEQLRGELREVFINFGQTDEVIEEFQTIETEKAGKEVEQFNDKIGYVRKEETEESTESQEETETTTEESAEIGNSEATGTATTTNPFATTTSTETEDPRKKNPFLTI